MVMKMMIINHVELYRYQKSTLTHWSSKTKEKETTTAEEQQKKKQESIGYTKTSTKNNKTNKVRSFFSATTRILLPVSKKPDFLFSNKKKK